MGRRKEIKTWRFGGDYAIVYFLKGIKRYLVVRIELASRFAFAYGVMDMLRV